MGKARIRTVYKLWPCQIIYLSDPHVSQFFVLWFLVHRKSFPPLKSRPVFSLSPGSCRWSRVFVGFVGKCGCTRVKFNDFMAPPSIHPVNPQTWPSLVLALHRPIVVRGEMVKNLDSRGVRRPRPSSTENNGHYKSNTIANYSLLYTMWLHTKIRHRLFIGTNRPSKPRCRCSDKCLSDWSGRGFYFYSSERHDRLPT